MDKSWWTKTKTCIDLEIALVDKEQMTWRRLGQTSMVDLTKTLDGLPWKSWNGQEREDLEKTRKTYLGSLGDQNGKQTRQKRKEKQPKTHYKINISANIPPPILILQVTKTEIIWQFRILCFMVVVLSIEPPLVKQ